MRAYSRRGNYHSDAVDVGATRPPGPRRAGRAGGRARVRRAARRVGREFLAHGEIEMRFVGIVLAGDTVDARVDLDDDAATFEIANTTAARTAVVGRARRSGALGPNTSPQRALTGPASPRGVRGAGS